MAILMVSASNNLRDLRKAMRNPSIIQRGFRRIIEYPLIPANNQYFKFKHGKGIKVINEDWDNLFILDACRYDYFADQNTINGELKPVTSRGSTSWEFMEGNFVDQNIHDTVYVTANPYVERLSDDVFFTVENVLDRWNEDLATVLPADIVNAAIDAHAQYPHKRLIVHFMQPHLPWLGSTARQIREKIDLCGWHKYHAHETRNTSQSGMSYWSAVRQGDISEKEMVQAYRETLDIVLDHAAELLNQIPGKSIITADHGEMLGEQIIPFTRNRYAHPYGIYTSELRTVPWLETHSDSRRDVIAEEPIGFERLDDNIVHDRLQALGYTPT